MFKRLVILFLLFLGILSSCSQAYQRSEIRINQLGYYPGASKKAIVTNARTNSFTIHSEDGSVVFEGELSEEVYWEKSGEFVRVADFTNLSVQGKYSIKVRDTESFMFEIRDSLYADALKASLKSYYYIRASMGISEEYGGEYNRNMGHPDTLCYFHPSAERGSGHMSSSKGWYDAGDYNKYVVNAGVTIGTIMNLYDMYPGLVQDGFTGIPESGNGISDLLDEVKYELDWVLSMQAPDGGSNFKLSSKGFTGFIMPEKDTTSRYVVGKTTAPTLNLAATAAQASRLFKDLDAGYSEKCLVAAEKAWHWAMDHPGLVFLNPGDVSTGQYSDTDFTEEFWWAAAELYLATTKQEYLTYLNENEPYIKMEVGESWRQFLGNIGSFSLLLADDNQISDLKKELESELIKVADELLDKLNSIPYRIAVDDFQWGSNSDIQNTAMIFAYASEISGEKKYLDAVVETMDYIFGKNATGYSFLTGFGTQQVMNIHNRICGADEVSEPIPGLISGGPNSRQQDEISKTKFGVKYPFNEAAKSFVDLQPSYASNENCINWNAPTVFVLGFLEQNADKLK